VGEGHIMPWDTPPNEDLKTGEVFCHWVAASKTPEEPLSDVRIAFDGSESLVIGAPHVALNRKCHCSQRTTKNRLRNSIRPLETYDSSRYVESETVEI
jgi:hypothetical protein